MNETSPVENPTKLAERVNSSNDSFTQAQISVTLKPAQNFFSVETIKLIYKIFDGSLDDGNLFVYVFAAAIIVGFISSFVQTVPSFR